MILNPLNGCYLLFSSYLDVRRKLEKLGSLWEELQTATSARGASLQRALEVAGEFWTELESVMGTLADLEASLASQQPPAVRPQAIVKQQQALQEIKAEIDQVSVIECFIKSLFLCNF